MNKLPLLESIKKQQEIRRERRKELTIAFGEQDPIDVLSYAGLEENVDYLCIDGIYIRTLFISGYPFVANSGWLDSIINFNHDTDISYHLHEVNALSALPKLHRKITELESTKRAMMRAGKIVGSEITDPLDIRAESLEELNKTTKLLEATLSARLFYS